MKSPLSLLAAICCVSALSAQVTVLTEDFNANSVPPAGWITQNLNGSTTFSEPWNTDGAGQAWHGDGGSADGQAENMLITPLLDFSGMSAVFFHMDITTNFVAYMAHSNPSSGNGVTTLEISHDGGLSWVVVWTDDIDIADQSIVLARDIDLSSHAGHIGVMLGVHFSGDYAHEIWIDNVVVNDSGPPPPPPPPGTNFVVNLPTAFAALPLTEDFSSGVVPPYMALTANDELDLPDAEAHCSVSNGQLEMGLDPLSTNYHYVRNAMVLGIDGSTMSGSMLDFDMNDYGEELNAMDGVHVSSDGIYWHTVLVGWSGGIEHIDIDLSAGGTVDTSVNFYVMIGQNDNYPYGNLDGVDIDNLFIDDQAGHGGGPPPPPVLGYTITGLTAGQVATFTVSGTAPGANVIIGYSLTGAGPFGTAYGVVDMSPPINTLATITADANGDAVLSPTVPANTAGVTLYTQALSGGILSNSLAEIVL